MISPTETSRRTTDGLLAAVGAYGIWGLAPLFWKLLEIPVLQITLWRLAQAAVLVVLFLWLRRRVSPRALLTGRVSLLHLGSGLLLTGNWFIYVYAVDTDRVVEASLGYFINPLMSVALGVVFLGERLLPFQKVAVGLASVGVLVLSLESGLPWISLALASTFAFYGLIRKRSPRGSLAGLGTELCWFGPPAGLALLVLAGQGGLELGDAVSAAAVPFIGAITAAPLLLFAVAARRLDLSMVGLMQYLAPTLQFLLGYLVFNEVVTTTRWAGSVLIWAALAALAVSTIRMSRRAAAGMG